MTPAPLSHRSELMHTLGAFRRTLGAVAALSFLINLLLLAPTLYMLQVFDRVLQSRSELTLLAVSLITLVLFVAMGIAEWLRSRWLVEAGLKFDQQLSSRVFNASFQAELDPTRHTTRRPLRDLMDLRQFLTAGGIFAALDAPWAPIYIAVTFFLHPLLGWLALVFVAVQVVVAWWNNARVSDTAEAVGAAANESTHYVHAKLRNAETVQAMGMVDKLEHHWARRHLAWLNLNAHAQARGTRMAAWSKFVRYSQQSLSLAAGALLVIDGQLSPGAMIAANLLLARALAPVDQLVSAWPQFVSARSAFLRLDGLLNAFPAPRPLKPQNAARPDVIFRQVGLAVPGRPQSILQSLNFEVEAGTVVGVLGPTGAGKSSLARVLLGLCTGVSGEVSIGGQRIVRGDHAYGGMQLGYLPQDLALFDGTIAENIARMGRVDATMVIAAARSTGLHEMILRLPKGYDTPMGEAGTLLSAGQRQRIGLARAVYGDPALIVLDEPNANLDEAGEAALVQTVMQLKAQGKTVFLITHRPGALACTDRLLVLRNGRLEADGARDVILTQLQSGATNVHNGIGTERARMSAT